MTLAGYLRYYDASAAGLRRAAAAAVAGPPPRPPRLRLGGPGGACRPPHFLEFCRGLLRHAGSGVDYFTGKKDVKLDFVSVHKKGENVRGKKPLFY